MWTKIKISEIRKDAIHSLYKDYNGRVIKKKRVIWWYFYILPFIIMMMMLGFHLFVNKDMASYFITGISIFAGLFFNLLLVVADKLNARKLLLENDTNEGTVNYVKRYRHFSEQLISQISYTIVLSIYIILLMFLTQFKNWFPLNENESREFLMFSVGLFHYLFNGYVYFLGVRFLIMLFVILSSMYVMLLDDLKIKR